MTKGSQRLTFGLRLRKRHFLEKKIKGIRRVFTRLFVWFKAVGGFLAKETGFSKCSTYFRPQLAKRFQEFPNIMLLEMRSIMLCVYVCFGIFVISFIGTCCLKDCAAKKACVPGCVEYSKCTTSQKGLFVEVRYFQFLDFDIHDDVKKKYFERVKEVEQKQQAQFEQDEKVSDKS